METEEDTTDSEEETGITTADIEHLGNTLGLSKTSCSYDNFVQALVTMINVFLNNELLSERINLDCLKAMKGQSCEMVDAVTSVFAAHENEVKQQTRYKEEARQGRTDAQRETRELEKQLAPYRLTAGSAALLLAMIQTDPDTANNLLHIAHLNYHGNPE